MAKAQRLIHTTPEAAFTYLSDLTRHGEWAINPGLTIVQTSPGAVMPGATFRSKGSQFGVRMEDELKVIDFQPPLRFAFDSTGRGGVFRHVFEFRRENSGTLVTKEMRAMEPPRLYSLFKPLSEIVLARRMTKDLKRIAKRIEADE
ncbi:MAG TPA: SRPBCC family protein [Dehalococcoidia bacterium]|nr:SRPBCC family protein [Dehalococcoidia bacterium]